MLEQGASDVIIDFAKDDDTTLVKKIDKFFSQSETLHEKKMKEYKTADAYFNGRPDLVDMSKTRLIANPLFPIIRNLVGLTSDPRPHPSAQTGKFPKDTPKEVVARKLEVASQLEDSLDDWWEDNKMQSALQRTLLSLYTYSDYFWMPYWDPDKNDVCIELISPRRVLLDPNNDEVGESDYAGVVFYRSRAKMYAQFGEEKCKDLKYADYKEIIDVEGTFEAEGGSLGKEVSQVYANVCKLQLYMEKEWWVYKVDKTVIEKMRAPFWATDVLAQQSDIKNKITEKYKKTGLAGVVDKGVDMVKGVVGMETNEEKINGEVAKMMEAFVPKKNYLSHAKIPLIQFDTYRFAGENYSRSTMEQSIATVDDINVRKHAITENSEGVAKPGTVVDGSLYNETDAQKLKNIRKTGEVARLDTKANKSLRESVVELQGTPLPAQFFEDIRQNRRDLDDIWGHHEASRGAGDSANPTKGGILALQEADQTPVRYITRNLEDSLQEVFQWVVQIRKLYKQDDGVINYDEVDKTIKTTVKTGSMLPVSKEAQRQQNLELYRMSAIDPLTLHERLGTDNPELTAQRLQAWLAAKQIMVDGGGLPEDQKKRVMMKLQLIQQGEFDKVQVLPDDDPKIHHDILLMALKSNHFAPQQEAEIAKLIQQYTELAKGGGASTNNQTVPTAGTQTVPMGGTPAPMMPAGGGQ